MNRRLPMVLTAAVAASTLLVAPSNAAQKTTKKPTTKAKTTTTAKQSATTAAPSSAPPTTAAAKATGPINIWMITSTSGAIAGIGLPATEGARMTVDKINAAGGIGGRQIKFTLKDDESKPDRAADLAREAIRDGAVAVIGGSTGSTCLSMRPLLVEAKIYQYCLSGAVFEFTDKYFFASGAEPTVNIGTQPAVWMQARGIKEAACIATNDAGGDAHANSFNAVAANFGIKVRTERFRPGDTDVTTQLIAAATAQTGVVYGCVSGTNLVPIIQAVNTMGLTVPVWAGLGAASVPVAIAIKDILPRGGVYTTGSWLALTESIPDSVSTKKLILDYAADYSAKFKKQPDTFSGTGADAVSLIAEAVKAGANDGTAIAAGVEAIKDFKGVSADYEFGPGVHRGAKPSGIIMQYTKNGDFKFVEMIKIPKS